MGESVIGVDIGGTNIRVGLLDGRLELIRKETALTGDFRSVDELFGLVQRLIAVVDPEGSARKIGIALPVPWREGTERIVDSTNVPCLEGLSVRQAKGYFPRHQVVLENDVNVIALLESAHGASKGRKHSMYITVSTGIGSGLILNGDIFHGANGYAGEVGGLIVSDNTLEALCSGEALEKASRLLFGEEATAPMLFERYRASDARAAGVVALWVERFSNAIASFMQMFDPEIFVIGGSVIHHNPWLIDEVIESARNKVLDHLKEKIHAVMPAFGPDAGVIGAGYAALNHFKGA
ncbi:ROK family protein [Paenibacillus montanisoli]|uniref:ROK family protein n=1 Tax=Paenibacillus montanisoli TaxID=2081970 RepID=A0A328TYG9_9BACL|nr:ROK family protein [Paenibacillus montanisoli]RAP74802.1 ROK family protein [Paenibacillus montanisoli]